MLDKRYKDCGAGQSQGTRMDGVETVHFERRADTTILFLPFSEAAQGRLGGLNNVGEESR